MKSLSTLFLALIALILFSQSAKADHVMGSDIRWECLGNDSFRITLTAYRDCNSDTISSKHIYALNQCSGDTITLTATFSEKEDITPTCDEACTRCSDSTCTDTRFGVHKIELTADVKLDRTKCCEWKITWGECCRSAGITTGAASANLYNEAWMNICNDKCNNSPYFTRPPVAIFCKDACTIYNPGVNDKDMVNGRADSLVYKLAQPFTAAGTPVTYSTGYSFDEPVSYNGDPNKNSAWEPNCSGFHLDTFTGELKFKPTKVEESVFAIVVEEWRKDSTALLKR